MSIRNRITELRQVRAGDLLADARNWRTHPPEQRRALQTILADVGYADAVIARQTPEGLVLVDGHLRADLDPEQEIPVLVTDLDETEAGQVLAVLDPLAGMAQTDTSKVEELLDAIRPSSSDALTSLLDSMHDPMENWSLAPPSLGYKEHDESNEWVDLRIRIRKSSRQELMAELEPILARYANS